MAARRPTNRGKKRVVAETHSQWARPVCWLVAYGLTLEAWVVLCIKGLADSSKLEQTLISTMGLICIQIFICLGANRGPIRGPKDE